MHVRHARVCIVGDFFTFETFEQYLDARLAGSGITLAELKEKGIHHLSRKTELYRSPGEDLEIHTPSGKVELYSEQLKTAGFDPLPVYRAVDAPPDGTFRLLYGRSPLHTFGRTQNNPILSGIEASNALWLHPRAAARFGIADGDLVEIRNRDGASSGALPAKLTERMPPDAVYMVHGFGHRARRLSRAHGRGGDDTAVIAHYAVDPISGATGMRTEIVTVHRVGERS
jgi:thiosulfate reductase/polysulfide reductase chain A